MRADHYNLPGTYQPIPNLSPIPTSLAGLFTFTFNHTHTDGYGSDGLHREELKEVI
jgi:hypothetical protein